MKKLYITAVALMSANFLFLQSYGQNVGINPTGASPNSSAGLDVDFSSMGMLIPRVTLTQTTLSAPVTSPATSLIVYNSATVNDVTPGYYYWDGTKWVRLINTGNNAGTEWLLSGNTLTGTLPATPNEWIGAANAADWIIKTNNIERMRVGSTGLVGINVSPAGAYLKISSGNSSFDGVDAYHTSASTTSAFNAVLGNVNNAAYTQATGYLAYHNTLNKTFSVYGNGGDLAGMFSGKVGINSVSTDITAYDMEVRNNTGANPVNVLLRQTTSNTLLNSVLGNVDFGDNYNASPQARIQVLRDAASSSGIDLPTAFSFWNMADGANTLTERMRISNNGNVGIGTISPSVSLEVSASDINTAVNIVNTTSSVNRFPRLNIFQYGPGGSAVLELHHANGTSTAPTATLNGDVLGTVDFDGHSGAAFFDGIKIQCIASENWSGTAQGNYLSFSGIKNGTTALAERMRLTDDGSLCIGSTLAASKLTVATSNANDGFFLDNGASRGAAILANAGAGSWNPVTQSGDFIFLYKGASVNNPGGGLVIAPWRNDVPTGNGIRMDAAGNVGIWESNPTNILTVVQSSTTDPIADAWTIYSSRRWKKNIVTIDNPIGKVQQLRGVYYDWKETGKHDIGLIAEEVGKVIPEVVAFEENGVDARSVDYARLVGVLIEAVKEQQKQITELKDENKVLKADIQDVKTAMNLH